jgi:hypothetical protein
MPTKRRTAHFFIPPIMAHASTQHVITVRQQAWLGALGTGPNGRQLSSAFGRRDDQEYQQELGETLIRLARVVPHGMLVFFPSYGPCVLCFMCVCVCVPVTIPLACFSL